MAIIASLSRYLLKIGICTLMFKMVFFFLQTFHLLILWASKRLTISPSYPSEGQSLAIVDEQTEQLIADVNALTRKALILCIYN